MGAGRIRLRVPNDFFCSFWVLSAFLICLGGTIVPAAAQGQWERFAGAASDIALAGDGTAWIIGATSAEKVPGGYRIFMSSPGSAQRTPVGGAALRIAVEGNTPWIVNEGGIIQRWTAAESRRGSWSIRWPAVAVTSCLACSLLGASKR